MLSNRYKSPTTPFIPPLISPEGSPAPVIPSYLYPTSPYENTPFIPPPISPLQTPGVIPGVKPSDYTGYPSGYFPPGAPWIPARQLVYAPGTQGWFQQQQAGFVVPPPFRRSRISPFSQGPHYGPVLEPLEAFVLKVPITFHTLLQPLPEDGSDQAYLKWNMLFPTATIHHSSDSTSQSWIEGRDQPATFPRLAALNVVSETFPWIITIDAASKSDGITCGEVIEGIARELDKFSGKVEYDSLPQQQQREVSAAYRQNRSRSIDAPGGILGQGMKRLDFLGRRTMFGGLEVNDRLAEKLHPNNLPCTFVLECLATMPMSKQEQKEQDLSMSSSSSEGHRSRANSTITVEPLSSADPDDADNDHGNS